MLPMLKRDNHFVPRFLLRYWTDDADRVWVYRLLVSHADVPLWITRSTERVAFRRDLYTLTSGGREVDEFERWIERDFETPAVDAVDRAVAGKSMRSVDWDGLAMLFALQNVRTPASFIESVGRWNREFPATLDSTLKAAVADLEDARRKGTHLQQRTVEPGPFDDVFQVRITPPANGEANATIEAGVVLGRKLWLASQRQVLEGAAKHLRDHKWSLAAPAPGTTWFTSDHPAVCLGYYGEGRYDFKAGWGQKKADLMMPLSPDQMLFTTVGDDLPDRFTFSPDKTLEIQEILATRAHRAIFATRRMRKVEWFRPRHVDPVLFEDEEDQWANWHRSQSEAE